MRQWFDDLALGHIKLFSTELQKKSILYTISYKIPFKNFSNYYFFIFFYFLQLKKNKI